MLDFIRQHTPAPDDLPVQVKTLGASQFDLYMGQLGPEEICAMVLAQVEHHTKASYQQWILENNGYRELTLPDTSVWTLQYLPKPAFVHLHPSRYSPHTLRMKANAMKSIVCYLLAENPSAETINIKRLNALRARYLQLPPVDPNGNYEEMRKIYGLLKSRLA